MTKFIAEIGINHNGDIDLALKLIKVAKEAGCDYVKFQKRVPDLSVPETQKSILRETPWGMMTYLDYKKRIEFDLDDFKEIDAYCKVLRIPWFVSVWDIPSVDFMEQFTTPIYKIPSAHLTNDELLNHVKKTGKQIILSTGMSTLEQIDHAVSILGEEGLIIMHCNSSYPAPNNHLNLKCIVTLKNRYPKAIIGYSGHEVALSPTTAAVVLGAEYVERHITLDRAMWGTDQSSSIEPQGLQHLVRDIRLLDVISGDGVKVVYPEEIAVLKKLRGV